MRYLNLLFTLILFCTLWSCSQYKTDSNANDKEIKIYIAWPGYTALPYYSWPEMDLEPNGTEVALIKELLKLKGYTPYFIPDYPYKDYGDPRIDALTENFADVSIRAISITEERKKAVDFSNPYFIDGMAVMVPVDSDIQSIDDLKGRKISTFSYTLAYNWVKEHIPSALITTEIDANVNSWILLKEGLVEAHVNDYLSLETIRRLNPGFRILKEKLTEDPLGIAIRKGQPKLKNDIDEALNILKNNGRLDEILSGYFNY